MNSRTRSAPGRYRLMDEAHERAAAAKLPRSPSASLDTGTILLGLGLIAVLYVVGFQ